MTVPSKPWTERLAGFIPNREAFSNHRWLGPVAKRLLHPDLWALREEAVARGVAVGTFWAFVIPFGQTLVAAVHCAWWRASIPAAAVMTMLTNPLTFGFWLWLAYQLGSLVLGESATQIAPSTGDLGAWLAAHGWPTVMGMGMFAVGGAALGYVAVKLMWRLHRRRVGPVHDSHLHPQQHRLRG